MNHPFQRIVLTTALIFAIVGAQAAEVKETVSTSTPAVPASEAAATSTAPVVLPILLPRVRIQTSQGDMVLELYSDKAPLTVANFLDYVREGNYDSTLFHRIINKFMIQGGAYAADYKPRYTHAAIESESSNGLKNERGTIAMARDKNPNTATNTFFINTSDNKLLNFHAPTPGHWGFAVFGRVIQGLEVLDRIQQTPTGAIGPFTQDAPLTPVVITKIIIEPSAPQVLLAAVDPKTVIEPAVATPVSDKVKPVSKKAHSSKKKPDAKSKPTIAKTTKTKPVKKASAAKTRVAASAGGKSHTE